jgi:hypothetical protein
VLRANVIRLLQESDFVATIGAISELESLLASLSHASLHLSCLKPLLEHTQEMRILTGKLLSQAAVDRLLACIRQVSQKDADDVHTHHTHAHHTQLTTHLDALRTHYSNDMDAFYAEAEYAIRDALRKAMKLTCLQYLSKQTPDGAQILSLLQQCSLSEKFTVYEAALQEQLQWLRSTATTLQRLSTPPFHVQTLMGKVIAFSSGQLAALLALHPDGKALTSQPEAFAAWKRLILTYHAETGQLLMAAEAPAPASSLLDAFLTLVAPT